MLSAMAYPREWLVIVLIAVSTLAVINPRNVQDVTRLSLSRSLAERGSVNIDPWAGLTTDRARFDGHWYSDKAPGISLLAIPTFEGLRGIDAVVGNPHRKAAWNRVGHIWLLRVLTSGIGLVAAAFLLGRASERLRPGYGAPLAFGSFYAVLVGRRHALVAGALAGLAVLFEYQAVLIALVVAGYVAVRY